MQLAAIGGIGHGVRGGSGVLFGAELAGVVAEADGRVFHAAGDDSLDRGNDVVEVPGGEQRGAGGSGIAAQEFERLGFRLVHDDRRHGDDARREVGAELDPGGLDYARGVATVRVAVVVLRQERRSEQESNEDE